MGVLPAKLEEPPRAESQTAAAAGAARRKKSAAAAAASAADGPSFSSSSSSSSSSPATVPVWAVSWASSEADNKAPLDMNLEMFSSEAAALEAYGSALYALLMQGDCECHLFTRGAFMTDCESCQGWRVPAAGGGCDAGCGNYERCEALKRGDKQAIAEAGGFSLSSMLQMQDHSSACEARFMRMDVPVPERR